MFVNSDFSDLLRLFNANRVEYLVIGGYALIHYAEPRYTTDLDLWIRTTAENASAVFQSLQSFGAPLEGLSQKDFAENGFFYQMGRPPVRIDILMGIPGIEFQGAWERRQTVWFDELPVHFISRRDLIVAKRASGRPQDVIDADLLSQDPETE
jgi:hypothetical protein